MAERVREIIFRESTYEVVREGHSSVFLDGGDRLTASFDPEGLCMTNDNCARMVLRAYYDGRSDGRIGGRIELQSELRRLIGAAAAEVVRG